MAVLGQYMGRYWLVLGGTGSWLTKLPNLVLFGIKWNWVSTRLLCLYILKKVKIWSDVTIAGRTDGHTTNKDQ